MSFRTDEIDIALVLMKKFKFSILLKLIATIQLRKMKERGMVIYFTSSSSNSQNLTHTNMNRNSLTISKASEIKVVKEK